MDSEAHGLNDLKPHRQVQTHEFSYTKGFRKKKNVSTKDTARCFRVR